jgi:hypothetical protein
VLAAIAVIVIVIVMSRSDGGSDLSTPTSVPQSTMPALPTTAAVPTPSTAVAPQLATSDASSRSYTVAASPFTVQLSFTGLCWVEARRGNSEGAVIVADAFDVGDAPTFTESAIWLRLGYPAAATVAVNGVPLPPIPGTDPFNVQITAGG